MINWYVICKLKHFSIHQKIISLLLLSFRLGNLSYIFFVFESLIGINTFVQKEEKARKSQLKKGTFIHFTNEVCPELEIKVLVVAILFNEMSVIFLIDLNGFSLWTRLNRFYILCLEFSTCFLYSFSIFNVLPALSGASGQINLHRSINSLENLLNAKVSHETYVWDILGLICINYAQMLW